MFNILKPHLSRQAHPRIVRPKTLQIQGRRITAKLTQSPHARRVRLKVGMQNGLEIIVPRRFQLAHIEHLIAEHEEWIIRQLDKLEIRKKLQARHQLEDNSVLHVLGEPHKIKILAGTGKPAVRRVQQLIFMDDRAIVEGHTLHVHCDGSLKNAKAALEQYLRPVAEKYFIKRTRDLAEQMGVEFKNITIRGQKTRWGSCTREKNLNFNWRLILLPLPVAESVIVHELAHTVHMNHSKAFYGFVERFCPDYRKLQKQLRNPQFLV